VLNDFTERVPVSGCDEIAQLGVGFNKMLAELNQRDVAKIAAERKLQNLAVTDELTGLPNRRLLSDRLAQSLAIAKRERHIVAILYLDLDGFKLVNDTFGHTMGDVLLEQVAQRLRSRIRESDTLARIGGDEFTVLLTRLCTREEAGQVGRALLDVLAEKFDIDNHEIRIGASIGISLFPDDATDGASLLQLADSAMYAAKRNGRNLVMEYTADLGSSIHERLSLETQLRGAVARGEVHLHYQPEFDASSRRLVRFEALARWFHPTLGTVPPDKFIPIAEESGQIITLGAYVMERACEAAVKWQALAPSPIQVAVNVSSLQFARPTFVEEVAEILRRTGLQPALLQIELTESIMLSGPEQAGEVMKKLHALGVTLAIDDFGTGYSCLSYLPRLPFDALKIDRSFVNELTTRPEMRAMVRSLVTLSHELKMQVIVEGIETLPQLELVKELGGNEVQGYLLGRPTANPESHLCGERSETESADFQEASSTEFNESLAGGLRI
jgi:diguanylate cyclase (GGDEF)-like protein